MKIRDLRVLWHRTNLMHRVFDALLPDDLREFPRVEPAVLEGFRSWDTSLGWRNPRNTQRPERAQEFKASAGKSEPTQLPILFTTDEDGSRVTAHSQAEHEISVFGDSFAMCREVSDNDAWPFLLGVRRGTKVTNFGTGNYGLDQALMLLETDPVAPQPATVVMAVTTATMARCVSVYRHYYENGNVLAVKPRFVLQGGTLELIDSPVGKKEELANLAAYRHHFVQFDDHRTGWLARRRKRILSEILNLVATGFAQRFPVGFSKGPHYELDFWTTSRSLFLAIVKRFSELSEKRGFRPVFVIQHQKHSLELVRSGCALPWSESIAEASSMFRNVQFVDTEIAFRQVIGLESLYSGGHHSPLANRLIAEYLDSELQGPPHRTTRR